MAMLYVWLLVLALVCAAGVGEEDGQQEEGEECAVTRCRHNGPPIRFPFRLKDRQPPHCGHPGFDLSCGEDNATVLELLPLLNITVWVQEIDYYSQYIVVHNPDGCLPLQLPNLDSSSFTLQSQFFGSWFALFNCSSENRFGSPITCLSSPGYQIYAFDLSDDISAALSCTKMYSLSWFSPRIFFGDFTAVWSWDEPDCRQCEWEGKYCRLKHDSPRNETQCFEPLTLHNAGQRKKPSFFKKLKVAGLVLGLCLFLLAAILLHRVYNSIKLKKEDVQKIKKFLEDYKALKPTRYSYADIKKITNQFKDKLGQGAYGTVFKGKLSDEIFVAVKVLNHSKRNGEEFINEVGIIGRIHHVNVVRLVGYCADGFNRALVYEFLPNNSLQKFTSSEDLQSHCLGWQKLQEIALGVAKGIEYLHQGCEHRILHFDIKPHNILLDHNLNPKIADFGQAKLCSKEQSVVSMTAARGTVGYIAPEVFSRNFGNVSYKADVYSFGMLLLEMVGSKRTANVQSENSSQVYFPEWVYNRLDQGEELAVQIEEEVDVKIARKLTIIGFWCIQWYPVDRPSMKVVIQMLERDGDTLTMPPNPFTSTKPVKTGAMHGGPFNRELEVISELE